MIPWTRLLTSMVESDLMEFCCAHRRELIIKRCVGWSAAGALLGADLADAEWADALHARVDRGYVVQRIVKPALEPVCEGESSTLRGWQANWGIFVTPRGYAGSFVRALKPEDGTVITFGNPGTRGTCVFSVPTDVPA